MHCLSKHLKLLWILSFSSTCMLAQAPDIAWQKCLGGSAIDNADVIHPTADGGYIMAGLTRSNDGNVTGHHGDEDFWIVKLNNNGVLQWQKSLGGSAADHAFAIKPTADGGYIVAGISQSEDGDVTHHEGTSTFFDYWVVKLDNTGTLLWEKTLGGSHHDIATSIEPTADGGYIVAGRSESYMNDEIPGHHGVLDAWIVKLNNAGDMEWQNAVGGSGNDAAMEIRQTPDGGYIMAGYSNSNDGDVSGNHGSFDYWIVKLDNTGAIQWQKSLGGSDHEEARTIELTADGGYIVAGFSKSDDGQVSGNQGDYDYWLVKIDATGMIAWQKSMGGSGTDHAKSIQSTFDGGYVVAGYSRSDDGDVSVNQGGFDYWVVKVDTSGAIQWEKSMGGSEIDQATSITLTTDGGYLVAGFSISNDGDVSGNQGDYDCWIVKLEAETAGVENVDVNKITIYPNPTADLLYFSEKLQAIRIVNLNGAEIARFDAATQVSIKQLASGIYALQALTMDGKSLSQKFIKR